MRVYPVLVVQLYGTASLHGIDEFGVGLPLSEVTRSIVPQEVDAHDVVLHDDALQFVASEVWFIVRLKRTDFIILLFRCMVTFLWGDLV